MAAARDASRDANEAKATKLLEVWEQELAVAASTGAIPSVNRVARIAGVSWHTARRALVGEE
eukprot:scaffold8381_cov449-Pinguiococcus_pyrenoidosus.AAC.1